MTRQLSPAELEQRRNAARSRWTRAAGLSGKFSVRDIRAPAGREVGGILNLDTGEHTVVWGDEHSVLRESAGRREIGFHTHPQSHLRLSPPSTADVRAVINNQRPEVVMTHGGEVYVIKPGSLDAPWRADKTIRRLFGQARKRGSLKAQELLDLGASRKDAVKMGREYLMANALGALRGAADAGFITLGTNKAARAREGGAEGRRARRVAARYARLVREKRTILDRAGDWLDRKLTPIKKSHPLSPAELEQRRNAARARWAAAGAVAGAGAAGFSIPQAFMAPRRPTGTETRGEFRQQGRQFMGALRREGATKQERSAIWVGERRAVLSDIKASFRPVGDRRVQTATAVALAALAAGIAAPSAVGGAQPTPDQKRAQAAVQWGGGVLGGLGALRAAMPAVRRVPRAAFAVTGVGAGWIAATRKDA